MIREFCLILLVYGFSISLKAQIETDGILSDSCFLVWHGDISKVFLGSLKENLEWVESSNIPEKDILDEGLNYRIDKVASDSKNKDTTKYEHGFLTLMELINCPSKVKKLVLISSCWSGEEYSCSEKIIIQTFKECSLYSFDANNRFKKEIFKRKEINKFLRYLKRKSTGKKKQNEEYIRYDNEFDIYVMGKDYLFAKNLFYAPDLDKFFDIIY